MIGLILVAVSWLLLRLESKSIAVLGFNLPRRRLFEFAVGLGIAGSFAAAKYLLQGVWSGISWELNSHFTLSVFLQGLRWNTNSTLYEELLFRGYLLYQAIRVLGARRGCFLSAIAFGVYHWFSFGVFGNAVAMAFVFLLTGAFGLMLAVAFARSGSVAMPIGLHLGWNLVSILVFSDGPIGPQLLTAAGNAQAASSTLQQLVTNLALPLLLPTLVLWLLVKKLYRDAPSESQS